MISPTPIRSLRARWGCCNLSTGQSLFDVFSKKKKNVKKLNIRDKCWTTLHDYENVLNTPKNFKTNIDELNRSTRFEIVADVTKRHQHDGCTKCGGKEKAHGGDFHRDRGSTLIDHDLLVESLDQN